MEMLILSLATGAVAVVGTAVRLVEERKKMRESLISYEAGGREFKVPLNASSQEIRKFVDASVSATMRSGLTWQADSANRRSEAPHVR